MMVILMIEIRCRGIVGILTCQWVLRILVFK